MILGGVRNERLARVYLPDDPLLDVIDLRACLIANNLWEDDCRLHLYRVNLTEVEANNLIESGTISSSFERLEEHFTLLSELWPSQTPLAVLHLVVELLPSKFLKSNHSLTLS